MQSSKINVSFQTQNNVTKLFKFMTWNSSAHPRNKNLSNKETFMSSSIVALITYAHEASYILGSRVETIFIRAPNWTNFEKIIHRVFSPCFLLDGGRKQLEMVCQVRPCLCWPDGTWIFLEKLHQATPMPVKHFRPFLHIVRRAPTGHLHNSVAHSSQGEEFLLVRFC